VRYFKLLAFMLVTVPAASQFRQLATDHTGSRVWFTTDLPRRGSGDPVQSRIWVADSQGSLNVQAQRPATEPYRVMVRPQVSADASVLAWDALFYCAPQGTCRNPETTRGVIARTGQPDSEIEGRIHLGRDGRWVLRESNLLFAPYAQVEIRDTRSGIVRQLPVSRSTYMEGGPRITSAGSALVYSNALWLLHVDGSYTYVPASGLNPNIEPSPWFNVRTPRVAMDDTGTLVVYESNTGFRDIYAVKPGDESSNRMVARNAWGLSLSANGRLLAYLAGAVPQAWVADPYGGEPRRVTDDPDGLAELTLSGDGSVIWAATLGGRIVRVSRLRVATYAKSFRALRSLSRAASGSRSEPQPAVSRSYAAGA
jgi:hypothetical protein